MAKRKVRFAVVGLGYFAQNAVLPAFAHAKKHATLAALVSGDARKLKKLAKRYDVARTAGYDEFDQLCSSGEIDAVYLSVPNHKHREYAERAAKHGIHVLIEKPMAVTEEDCEAIAAACRVGNAKLMVAYRLHFEEGNLHAAELVRKGKLGDARMFHAVFTLDVNAPNIRLNPAQEGGGPLYDIGVYCINAARSLFADEPTEVIGMSGKGNGDARFSAVEEQLVAALRFPGDRLASFHISFGAASRGWYEVVGTQGSLRLDPAFDYRNDIESEVTIGGKTKRKRYKAHDQIGPELEYFAECILQDREPEPSGREGQADVRVVRALYRSLELGRPVELEPFAAPERPRPQQARKDGKQAKPKAPIVDAAPETSSSN